jgi:hypothetical protein
VTTDLSGFGAYVERHVPDALQNGVLVLNRSKVAAENCIEQLTSYLVKFCELNRRERIALRNRAERITERFTWDVMAAHYHRAHSEALRIISQTAEPRSSTSSLIPRSGIENLDTLTISPNDGVTTLPRNEALSSKSKR